MTEVRKKLFDDWVNWCTKIDHQRIDCVQSAPIILEDTVYEVRYDRQWGYLFIWDRGRIPTHIVLTVTFCDNGIPLIDVSQLQEKLDKMSILSIMEK